MDVHVPTKTGSSRCRCSIQLLTLCWLCLASNICQHWHRYHQLKMYHFYIGHLGWQQPSQWWTLFVYETCASLNLIVGFLLTCRPALWSRVAPPRGTWASRTGSRSASWRRKDQVIWSEVFWSCRVGILWKNTSSTCKVQPWWWCGADTEQFWVKILHHNRQLCNPLWSQIAWWFIRHRRQRYRPTLIVPSCKPLRR